MRPLLAIAVWVVLIGGLSWYMQTRQEVAAVQSFQPTALETKLTMEVNSSFAMEPDPFALQVDERDQAVALLVRLNGRDVLKRTEKLADGSWIVVDNVQGLVEGRNEFYVEAYPMLKEASQAHAVRIRVKREDQTIAERTLWSEPGSRIAATFSLEIEPTKPLQDNDHGH
jgi:hypothetical protein